MGPEPASPSAALHRQHGAILASLPLITFGLFLIVFALVNAAWPPDYLNPPAGQTVSHWRRLIGDDVPGAPPPQVLRPVAYELRRLLDGLVYVGVMAGIVSVVGLGWFGERLYYLPLMVTGLCGLLYSAGLGIVIGPMLASAGFALVLLGAILGWLVTQRSSVQQQQVTIQG
jgi:hypothetical protein